MDSIDLRILDILQTDGRITMKELGNKVGLTSPATIERVKKLEENGVISSYKAVINIKKTGLPIHAFLMVATQGNNFQMFTEYARNHQSILECHRIAADFNYLIKVAVSSMADLEKMADEIMAFGRVQSYMILSSPIENKAFIFPGTAQF